MGLLALAARRRRDHRARDRAARLRLRVRCSAASRAFDNPARQAFVNEIVGPDDAAQRDRAQQRVVQPRPPRRPRARRRDRRRGRQRLGVPAQRRCRTASPSSRCCSCAASELRRKDMQAGQVQAARRACTTCAAHRDLLLVLVLVFGVGTFGLNYQITMALMANQEFEVGAAGVRHHVDLARLRRPHRIAARRTTRALDHAARRRRRPWCSAPSRSSSGSCPPTSRCSSCCRWREPAPSPSPRRARATCSRNAAGWVRGRVLGHLHARLLRRHPDRGAGHRLGGRAVRAAQRPGRRRRRDRGVDPRGCAAVHARPAHAHRGVRRRRTPAARRRPARRRLQRRRPHGLTADAGAGTHSS